MVSPFLYSGSSAPANALAVLNLRKDSQIPVVLQDTKVATDGYAEGAVTNTRFGSFPHSTLIGKSWGSQVLASKVDTGSRAKRGKRKRDVEDDGEEQRGAPAPSQAAVQAGTGFAHLFQPTPESWTVSLPHRTQVVYTHDYSYILQRMRVCPGSTLIEAGAGSGSFTHAAARAVFNWSAEASPSTSGKPGHVYSFEYHEPRVRSLKGELVDHGLADLVTVTHRDVYTDGFSLSPASQEGPGANAVFLDLPAPWLALRHLTRSRLSPDQIKALAHPQALESPLEQRQASEETPESAAWTSPLDPASPIHLCTFTPCIEQVSSVEASLRHLGWSEIHMVEVANRRLDVRRERIGYAEEGLRGAIAGPKDVQESVERLLEVEGRFKQWEETMKAEAGTGAADGSSSKANGPADSGPERKTQKQIRQERNREEEKARKTWNEGILVSRTEQEVKSHTSYLVFAVLPVEWTEEDERKANEKWPVRADTEKGVKK